MQPNSGSVPHITILALKDNKPDADIHPRRRRAVAGCRFAPATLPKHRRSKGEAELCVVSSIEGGGGTCNNYRPSEFIHFSSLRIVVHPLSSRFPNGSRCTSAHLRISVATEISAPCLAHFRNSRSFFRIRFNDNCKFKFPFPVILLRISINGYPES